MKRDADLKKLLQIFKKDIMLGVSVLAALLSLFITPPGLETLKSIDWKTLATLFVLLLILDGFKHENLFLPVIRLSGKLHTRLGLSIFLVFGVFFSSMLVTNDVSLIIFVPLTMTLFRAAGMEEYILPVLTLENIAAVRGSLLTPFGSPQNLFLFSQSGMSTSEFFAMMLPLWLMSIVLLLVFLVFLYRKNRKEPVMLPKTAAGSWNPERKKVRIVYFTMFVAAVAMIVSRTSLWPFVVLAIAAVLLISDRDVFRRVDYALILTFFCFFVFSSSICGNEKIAGFLSKSVAGREYIWSLALSQIISNVPASIVLWPFSTGIRPLIYGLDTAGLISIIGSLASVINLRLYLQEYPGRGGKFMITFEKISLAYFAVVAPLQLLFM